MIDVEQAVGVVDIAEHRSGTRVHHSQRGGDERVRGNDHLVPGTDASGAQGDRERGGSRGYADAVLDAAIVGELSLEALDLLAEDERARAEHPLEGLRQLGP